ncbi:hypothetical protein DPMN_154201 [Dreissena polymorpha]|uniref:Tyrosinase copper-binding domain-containing protein n=1 Tax=Dreissena polymorpha TaxID=45954 RepID=A0A9D4J9N2_DREPO|nr:hypothetical protein DPMN_154201 [Dreissena polymorpha]
MLQNGEYDTFAQLHRGIVTTSAHGGPNFLGWHRVYLALYVTETINMRYYHFPEMYFLTHNVFVTFAMLIHLGLDNYRFEEALRRIDGQVSLPYWDSILDNDMENPVNTILFSPAFFGNGDKQVTSGPFANWVTPIGPLTRNISGQGMLFNKEHIRMIMTRCRARDIIAPAPLVFNLDIIHGGIHLWVGGQMSGLHTAAHDPVFFLHHAFVDYIWEMFRNHQFFNCEVNPSLNYPEVTGQHAPERPMDGLPGYVNIDGYQSFWTQNWYRFERAPTCPDCGSPYLTCDPVRDVCVSVERTVVQTDRGLELIQEVANLVIGQTFVGPGDDPRTQVGLARMALASRKKRAIPKQADTPKIFGGTDSNQRIVKLPLNVGEKFLSTENDNRTSIALRRNIARVVFSGNIVHNATQDVYSGNAFPVASPMSLLPALVSDTLDLYKQNTSYYTSISAASDWLFVPVQMTYGVVGTNNSDQTPSTKCLPTSKIWTHIKVSAQGLNYLGEYTDFGVVDTSKPLPSTHAIIAIRAPEVGPSITMVTASHGCGLMCTPKCITNDAGTYQYRPCTGILWITPEDAIAYAREHTVAEESIRRGDAKFPIVFECHNESQIPWQRLRNYEQ